MNLKPELKKVLIDAEQYPEFMRFRQMLVADKVSPDEATRRAIDCFFEGYKVTSKKKPVLRSINARENQVRSQLRFNVPDPTPSVQSVPPAKTTGGRGGSSPKKVDISIDDIDFEDEPSSLMGGTVGDFQPLPELDNDELSEMNERHASEVDIIRWVARNMAIRTPSPKSCPDPTAWGLLTHCRASRASAAEFWKQTYPKLLPTKAQLDSLAGREKDETGGRAAEVIDELLGYSQEVVH